MLLTFATTFGRISPCRLIDSVDNRTSRNRCTTPVSCFAHTASNSRHGTYERVLRYPDGHERRIRYPAPVLDEESVDVHGETWESLNYWTALATKKRRPESSKAAGSEVAEDKDLRASALGFFQIIGFWHAFLDTLANCKRPTDLARQNLLVTGVEVR